MYEICPQIGGIIRPLRTTLSYAPATQRFRKLPHRLTAPESDSLTLPSSANKMLAKKRGSLSSPELTLGRDPQALPPPSCRAVGGAAGAGFLVTLLLKQLGRALNLPLSDKSRLRGLGGGCCYMQALSSSCIICGGNGDWRSGLMRHGVGAVGDHHPSLSWLPGTPVHN